MKEWGYLKVALNQLEELEFENQERPPGDERAETTRIIEKVRDMIIRAEEKQGKGKSIIRDIRKIEDFFTGHFTS